MQSAPSTHRHIYHTDRQYLYRLAYRTFRLESDRWARALQDALQTQGRLHFEVRRVDREPLTDLYLHTEATAQEILEELCGCGWLQPGTYCLVRDR